MEELDSRLEEARQKALDIDEGSRSLYWKHLKSKISGWMATEIKSLEMINATLIRTQDELDRRNDSVKKIALLGQFLRINEIITDECLTMININNVPKSDSFKRTETFLVK